MVGSNGNRPAAQAVNDWNSNLAGTGVEFEIVDEPCGTAGDCIEMQTTADTINGCADFTPSSINLSTGAIPGQSAMRFPAATWQDATDDRMRRSVAHELGATTTDVLPVTKSTYGDQVRVSCGF